WAAFHDFLARELRASCLLYDLSEASALAKLVEDELRNWDRRFDDLVRRYSDFAGIALRQLPVWDQVHHAHELRNALVHNQGQYTQKYLNTRLAHRPTQDELHGFSPGTDDALINREVIPLSLQLVDGVITQLLVTAREVRAALNAKRNA